MNNRKASEIVNQIKNEENPVYLTVSSFCSALGWLHGTKLDIQYLFPVILKCATLWINMNVLSTYNSRAIYH